MAFNRIEPETLPWLRFQYAQGVLELKEGRPDQATQIFETVAEKAPQKTEIRNRALQSLARMLYEEKKYGNALTAYEKMDSSVLSWDHVFLEKAWNTYQLDKYQRSLGYLHALQAPIFAKSFQPEKYLLIGLVLRRLCRYSDARGAVGAFREYFGPSVEHIRNGRNLDESETIAKAARTRAAMKAQADFLERLEKEKKKVKGIVPRRMEIERSTRSSSQRL